METSAGTFIILNQKKVLLCHPTNANWKNSFGPPKGHLEKQEDLIACAIRETFEEIGVKITPAQMGEIHVVDYIKKNNELTKKVYLFEVHIKSLADIGLTEEVLNKKQLQTEEVDWAGFMSKDEAKSKIFFRFKHLLKLLK
jgi:ADP-ribose pyrophosphatase YjhB (NUDIX family)